MAAAALCYLGGGDAEAICHAAALAIKSLLGLVCDPIAGLVEVPCIKRNASGAMVAMCCADMGWPESARLCRRMRSLWP